MDAQQWLILAVVVVLVAVFFYRRSLQTRKGQERNRQSTAQAENQARSSAENISQREDRRLAGMTVEDRAWEQTSLQRHRLAQAGAQSVEVTPDLEPHR
jgi:membrane protein implicated in regulation of membrane protease activity